MQGQIFISSSSKFKLIDRRWHLPDPLLSNVATFPSQFVVRKFNNCPHWIFFNLSTFHMWCCWPNVFFHHPLLFSIDTLLSYVAEKELDCVEFWKEIRYFTLLLSSDSIDYFIIHWFCSCVIFKGHSKMAMMCIVCIHTNKPCVVYKSIKWVNICSGFLCSARRVFLIFFLHFTITLWPFDFFVSIAKENQP